MKKILLGQKNRLKAAWKVDFGMYLEGDDEGKILLPARYVPEDLEVGDEIDVFVYLDNEERRVATTLEPKAMVGDFAYLEVAWVNEFGAFLDWGLMKDLFCPFREQKKRMEVGRSYIVHVHLDEESYRIMASAKIEKWLENDKLAKEYIPSAEKEDTILSQREKGDLSTPPLGEAGRGGGCLVLRSQLSSGKRPTSVSRLLLITSMVLCFMTLSCSGKSIQAIR